MQKDYVVKCGCPQWDVFSPLFWNIVVDVLLRKLNRKLQGRFRHEVLHFMTVSNILMIIEEWCREEQLRLNQEKNKSEGFFTTQPLSTNSIYFFGNEVKYLRLTLDIRLTPFKHYGCKTNRNIQCTRIWTRNNIRTGPLHKTAYQKQPF